MLVQVDDLIMGGSCSVVISRFKSYHSSCFHTKDLRSLKYFLGIQVAWSLKGIFISQQKHALDILNEVRMLGCKPMETNHLLALVTSAPMVDPNHYRRLISRLIISL